MLHRITGAIKERSPSDVARLVDAIRNAEDTSPASLENILAGQLSPAQERHGAGYPDVYQSVDAHGRASVPSQLNYDEADTRDHSREEEHDAMTWTRSHLNSHNSTASPPAFYNLPMSSAILTNHYPPYVQSQQLNLLQKPQFLCTPTIVIDSTFDEPLTRATLTFLHSARAQILAGTDVKSFLSMDGMDVSLLSRDHLPSDPYNVSTWACETMRSWPHFERIVHIAGVYFIGTFMRWLILPTRETWDLLSLLMRPLPIQVMVPHSNLWFDLTHIPQLRHSQIQDGRAIQWLLKHSHWATCNWPWSENDCVETTEEGLITPTKRFMRHVDDLKNWSIRKEAIERFPELASGKHALQTHSHGS